MESVDGRDGVGSRVAEGVEGVMDFNGYFMRGGVGVRGRDRKHSMCVG